MGYRLGALWKENINPAEVMSTEAIWEEREVDREEEGMWTPPVMDCKRWEKLIFGHPLLGSVR